MLTAGSAAIALLIGFVPIFVWLAFWLLEDRRHPEPERLIVRAFIGGMVAVLLVLPLQNLGLKLLPMGFPLILLWAAIEEAMKLGVAWVLVLRKVAVDEPIDVPVYLITVALGFAALENTLFLLSPIGDGQFVQGFITGNLRFLGATLIHVLSSAVIGGAIALAFYREGWAKIRYAVLGVILAIFLHALFNFSIIKTSADQLLTVFAGVWVGITFLLLALERVKRLKRPEWWRKLFVRRR